LGACYTTEGKKAKLESVNFALGVKVRELLQTGSISVTGTETKVCLNAHCQLIAF